MYPLDPHLVCIRVIWTSTDQEILKITTFFKRDFCHPNMISTAVANLERIGCGSAVDRLRIS